MFFKSKHYKVVPNTGVNGGRIHKQTVWVWPRNKRRILYYFTWLKGVFAGKTATIGIYSTFVNARFTVRLMQIEHF